jgi:hypothetical protein
MDRFIASLPEAEHTALIAEATRDLAPLHPMMTKAQQSELAGLEVRRCQMSRASIPSFAEWRERRDGFDRRAAAG